MKRILIFSLSYLPDFVGGAEIAIKEITDRISPQDIEFHLITLRYNSMMPRYSREGNVHVYRIGFGRPGTTPSTSAHPLMYLSKILYIPLATFTAIRLNQRLHLDGIWAMMTYMLFPIVLMRALGVRIPYAVTLQEGDPFEHVFRRWYIALFRPLLVYGFKNATAIQAISTFLASWVATTGTSVIPVVIPNGVDVETFSAPLPAERRAALRAALGGGTDALYLVTTSRLVYKNGIDSVIGALSALSRERNIHFVVYGTGPEEADLRETASLCGVSDRVHFMGHLDHQDIPQALKTCDIFIRASRSEGMGNSFVEAMVAGLPTIGTPVGGIPDVITDGETGFLTTKPHVEGVRLVLERMLENPANMEKIAKEGQRFASAQFAWDRIVGEMRSKVFAPLFKS